MITIEDKQILCIYHRHDHSIYSVIKYTMECVRESEFDKIMVNILQVGYIFSSLANYWRAFALLGFCRS